MQKKRCSSTTLMLRSTSEAGTKKVSPKLPLGGSNLLSSVGPSVPLFASLLSLACFLLTPYGLLYLSCFEDPFVGVAFASIISLGHSILLDPPSLDCSSCFTFDRIFLTPFKLSFTLRRLQVILELRN